MDNKLFLSILSVYLPCEVYTNIDNCVFQLHAVDMLNEKVLIQGDFSGGTHNVDQTAWMSLDLVEIKLPLKSLEHLEDKDARTVAKLGGATCSEDRLVREGKSLIHDYLTSHNCNLSGIDWWRIKDYLRYNMYDCGFREIKHLLESDERIIDIATIIKKTV